MGLFAAAALSVLAQAQPVRPPQRLDASGAATSLACDADADLFAVAWTEGAGGAGGVWCAISGDGGRSWAAPARVDAGGPPGAAKEIQEGGVDVAGGEVRVLWLDARDGAPNPWFRASRDGGANWEAERRVDDGHAPGAAATRLARPAGSGADVAIALCQTGLPGGDEVRVARSSDGGRTFAAAALLHAGGSAPRADLAADGARLHLVWMDDVGSPGVHAARYRRSPDAGASWPGAPVAVSGSVNTMPECLRVAARGARVAVVFQDLYALHAVGSNLSNDAGATWLAAPLRVANSRSPSVTPSLPRLLLVPGLTLVAWHDDRTPGSARPWLAWTADRGVTWTERGLGQLDGETVRLGGDPYDGSFAACWRAGDRLRASVSRAAAPDPLTPFAAALAAAPPAAFDHAYEPGSAHHLLAWLDGVPGGAEVWAGGFRAPAVEATGALTPGSPLRFEVRQFRASDAGRELIVLLARGAGDARLPLGDGRRIGLAGDAWLAASARHPALRGTISAAGDGATGTVTLPPGLAPGTSIRFAAVAFEPPSQSFGGLTDDAVFVVL